MVTEVSTGAEFCTVTLAERAVPVVLPSLGVTVQLTVSPAEKPLLRVLDVPAALPLTVQA